MLRYTECHNSYDVSHWGGFDDASLCKLAPTSEAKWSQAIQPICCWKFKVRQGPCLVRGEWEWLLGVQDNSIPEVWEREENGKTHSQNSRTGKECKNTIPTNRERGGNEQKSLTSRTGRERKNNITKLWEREGIRKIHFHGFGTGISGFHSREWTETGIPACSCLD